MNRWSDTKASPAKHKIERLSNVWFTAVQFFKPLGLPKQKKKKLELMKKSAGCEIINIQIIFFGIQTEFKYFYSFFHFVSI